MSWTRPFRPVIAGAEKLVDRAIGVVGAVAFAQLPEFMQQYLQRLGGHLDKARRQLAQFQDAAVRSGLTLDRLAADAQAQADPAIARLGRVIAETSSRVDDLASAESSLRSASAWTRPFVFLRHLDPGIARATASEFRPAVPTTAEGLVYAAAGLVVALGLYHGLVRYPVSRAWRARARTRPQPSL